MDVSKRTTRECTTSTEYKKVCTLDDRNRTREGEPEEGREEKKEKKECEVGNGGQTGDEINKCPGVDRTGR